MGSEGPSLVARYALPPDQIEARSLAIIESLLPPLNCSPEEREVIKRIVHAVGDPEIARHVFLHPQAVAAGLEALRRGRPIFTDVQMVAVGIHRGLAGRLGCPIQCMTKEPKIAERARVIGITRAIAALRHYAPRLEGAIVAIGNAPTALLALLDLADAGQAAPALIIGVPVGFVAAAEAKAELTRRRVPYLTVEGTRGGSAMAVAAVNALLRLAQAQ